MMNPGDDVVAAELLALENRALDTLGTGTGDSGYGQIFNPVSVQGQDVTNWHLDSLREMLNTARRHQLGNDTGFGTGLPKPGIGSNIDSALMDIYKGALTTIENERLNYGPASMTVTGRLATLTRTGRWGPRVTITGSMDATWASENEARWFFNSGGELRINLGHPSTSTRQDRAWNRTLARIGTIRFRARSTLADLNQVGTPVASAGYYTLSGNTAIYNGNRIDDTFDYMDARYTPPTQYAFKDSAYIFAQRITNGVRFQIQLQETNNEINNVGTWVGFSAMYATRYLRNRLIRLPSFSVTTAL